METLAVELKTEEVEVDTLIDEQVCDVEGIFKKSAAGFGVLPTANCEDRSLDDIFFLPFTYELSRKRRRFYLALGARRF